MKLNPSRNPAELRRLAEERLATQQTAGSGRQTALDSMRLVHELEVHQIELEMQNEELRATRAEIEASQARYFDLYDQAPVGYVTLSEQGLIQEANLTSATLLGVDRAALAGQPLLTFIFQEDQDTYNLLHKKLFDAPCSDGPSEPSGTFQMCELRMVRPDGTTLWIRLDATAVVSPDGNCASRVVLSDIDERKQAENYRAMGVDVLQILNEADDFSKVIPRVIAALKTRTGFDAVGMRLYDGEDFPYYAQDGYSAAFLQEENTLVERGQDGGVCRNHDGQVCLECTCGLVISGRTDAANPLFSRGGSSWTNNSFPLLDLPPDQDPRLHPRNQCIHEGYASVALVPIRTKERIVGLLHLSDHRKDRFSLRSVELLESIASHIGAALMRKQAEEALRQRVAYEQLLHEASTLALVSDDLAAFRTNCLALIGERLDVDRTYFFRHDEATDTMHNTNEWCAEGITPQQDKLQGLSGSSFSWWMQAMRRNEVICYPNIDDIPDETTRQMLAAQGIISILAVPLFIKGQYYGFLGIDDCAQRRDWRQEDIDILLSLSKIVSMVTERRQAEEINTRLVAAIEQSAETIMIADAEGLIIYVNPSFETTTGYRREEILGRNPRILQSGKQNAAFYRGMWALLTAGETWRGHMVNKRKDGTLYEEDATISPVLDEAGKIINYVASKRDVTHQTQLEVQLRQAQKMESVGRLAGGVAHDFNNLLMGIMGYAELCRDEIAPGHRIREYLDEIILGTQRSADITRQLLAFARKQTIAPITLDLNDAVGGMLKMLRRLLGEGVKFSWRPGANLGSVKLDPSQIDQILVNLCVNARDAIAGVGEIILETGSAAVDAVYCAGHPEAIPGAYVFLTVSDDGCGMDKETLAQVFEPFFTTKGVGEGTGLGLATVYGIVKQNNGFIYAYSELGKGTMFKIYLPQIASEIIAATVSSKTEVPCGRGETILLAEDEKSLRVTCGLILKALGYEVLVAESPAEALKLIGQYPGEIHVLLTDVVMPGMDGRQLAQHISVLKPGVKVVFMSGYTADVIVERGVLDEGVQFLSKPFTRDDLAHKLREVLGE